MISYKGKEYVEYDNAIALLEEKDKEIERLNNIIDKAIEYIEKYITEQGETLPYYNYQKVIAILKGVDRYED